MAEFSDIRNLNRQAASRELRTVKDPEELKKMKALGFDHTGRSTGWGKFLDVIGIGGSLRRGAAKNISAGTDARRVLDETTDEFWNYQMGKANFAANAIKTGMTMGASEMAGGGGGFGGFLGNIFQKKDGMPGSAGAGSGGVIPSDNMSDQASMGAPTNNMVAGTSNNNLEQDYPEGTMVGEDGFLYDQEGNKVDYDMEAENNKPENKFMGGLKQALNGGIIQSGVQAVTSGIDYYNAQDEELSKLRSKSSMDSFNLL